MALRAQFERLLALFQSDHPYRSQMLALQVMALLYECRRLYDAQERSLQLALPRSVLASRFQQFVDQHFLTRKTVEAYADLLAVSPDYLGQAVKAATGKTAHSLIADRVLVEAKKLLAYSNLSVAEVADTLGYAEPTHFGRFFRRSLGLSPSAWRQQNNSLT